MKNLITLLFTNFLVLALVAQVPGEINYQGVARNNAGSPLPNQQIKLRLTIRNGSNSGNVEYQETRSLKTNSFGMFTVAIGGTGALSSSGTLQAIAWGNGKKYLQVEIDPAGGSAFVNMGAAQLLSVPYALYAAGAAPSGSAGGSLQGNYPNPTLSASAVTTATIKDAAVTEPKLADNSVATSKIKDGAISTAKIADGSITANKLAADAIPSALPPSGSASGDLSGSYPNPSIAAGAVTSTKIADGSVSTTKMADGSVTTTKLSNNAVTTAKVTDASITSPKLADAAVTNAKLGDGAVTTAKLTDASVTGVKLADGSVTTTKLSNNAVTTAKVTDASITSPKLADAAVTNAKLGDGAVTTAKLTDASVTGAKLADGSVTSVKLSDASVTNTKLADASVTTAKITDASVTNAKLANASVSTDKMVDASVTTVKIQNGAITAEKLAPGLVPGGSTPTGSAGGDLSGNYPDPSIASGAVTQSKIANGSVITPKLSDGAVTTAKIADGSVTSAKLAAGLIPTALPPNGTAGGDLSGTYPNPAVGRIQGTAISATAPSSGQVLKFNGTQWAPAADNTGSFSLPYTSTNTSATGLFSLTNQGAGSVIEGINSSATPSSTAASVRGAMNATGADGFGVWGSHGGNGAGVYGSSPGGAGLKGYGVNGYGVYGSAINGVGVFGTSDNGIPGFFNISNATNSSDALFTSNSGFGNGLVSISTYSHGVLGIANDVAGAGVFGINNAGGEAVLGMGFSDFAAAVVGTNYGMFAGLRGVSAASNGTAVLAQANVDGADNGTALVAELQGGTAGDLAVFKSNGSNVARIDHTGKGFFNAGTQVGGADVAEFFAVEGNRFTYEPGDVLVISTSSDRRVEKSATPYSSLVSGVFATKPGLMLTEENAEQDNLDQMVPMGVIGVLPTKVCVEGGVIRRGDLIVTSSQPGVAMKGDPDKVKIGQVLGKALQDYNGEGVGIINVLVSVK